MSGDRMTAAILGAAPPVAVAPAATVPAGAIEVLQRIRAPRPPKPRPGERCEMCTTDIGDEHSHVVDLDNRSLMCTCRGCYLLFENDGAGGKRFRAVPEDYRAVPGFALSPGQWEELQIPVSVAFFFVNSREERVVGFYPSPAGATESLLPMDAWERLTSANPELADICSDVEALLVRAPSEGYVVPIDACYELVGHMRRLWQGFDGGQEARAEMNAFFERVKSRATPR
jgi:hypothetical protein